MKKELHPLQIEARKRLASAARHLRSLRGKKEFEKELEWTKNKYGNLQAKVGTGFLIIMEVDKGGVKYSSSFGADSEKSFGGYLPGLKLEEAKKLIYYKASLSW